MIKRFVKKKGTIKGNVRTLTMVVFILVLFLSGLLYRSFYIRQYETILASNEALLNTMSVSIEDNAKMVENLINLLCYDKSVISLLKNKTTAYSQIVRQVFDIQELIAEREAMLSQLGGDIVIFSDRETIPDSYWYILNIDTAEEMEGYRQFVAEGNLGSWTGEEMMYPESTVVSDYNRKNMLSYYRLITDSIYGRLGVIKCGVEKKQFLDIVTTAETDGRLFVTWGDQIIYGDVRTADALSMFWGTEKTRYNTGSMIYIAHPIKALDMNIVIALDKGRLIQQAAVYALPQMLMIFATGMVLLTVSRKFTRSIYRRVDQIVEVAEKAKKNYMEVTLPNFEDDDISVLIDAFNTLIGQIRTDANERIEHEQKEKSALRLALQYQMNPHFLFNTLNWIQMCIELGVEPEKTTEGIVILGRLLRYNLNGEAYAPISEEIERTQDYVRLMNMRKNDAIFLNISLTNVEPEQQLMRFMLQPLCENAIQHGLIAGRQLHIEIQISKAGQDFMITVKNDGKMIGSDMIEEVRRRIRKQEGEHGVGLANLYSRVKLLYGDFSDLMIESEEEKTSIILKLKATNALQIFEEVC